MKQECNKILQTSNQYKHVLFCLSTSLLYFAPTHDLYLYKEEALVENHM